jgi:hypothetical protein
MASYGLGLIDVHTDVNSLRNGLAFLWPLEPCQNVEHEELTKTKKHKPANTTHPYYSVCC